MTSFTYDISVGLICMYMYVHSKIYTPVHYFILKVLLTKTVEKDTKDTSTHISKCNRLSLKV